MKEIIKKQPPHYISGNDVDAGGHPQPSYWRQFLFCSDGSVVTGIGATAEESEKQASDRQKEKEELLSKTPYDQLIAIYDTIKEERRSPYPQEEKQMVMLIVAVLRESRVPQKSF